jgi:hypothetical protein
MPPFEYDPKELFETLTRLANEKDMSWRFTKKGDKRPIQDVEAMRASRKRNIRAKQEAATERTLARVQAALAARQPKPGEDIASRMLKAMRPGEWYGMGDLMRMVGADRQARGKVRQVLLPRGWVQAGHNPAYRGRRLNPQEIMAGGEPEPMRLYRLTEGGTQKRAELLSAPPVVEI